MEAKIHLIRFRALVSGAAIGVVLSLGAAHAATLDTTGTTLTLTPQNKYIGNGTLTVSGGGTLWLDINGTAAATEFAMGPPAPGPNGGLIDIVSGTELINGGWQKGVWTNNLAGMRVNGTFNIWDGNGVKIDALTGSGTVTKTHGGNSPTLLTVGVNNGRGTFSGSISNAENQIAFTKDGSGSQTLSGANTYTGATTISGGSLQLGDGGTSGSLSSSSAITNNGNLTINRSDALTVANVISGSGTLTKTGGGTLTLEGDKAYSGGTTITGGTLKVGRSTLGTGAVVVNSGGTLYANDQWVLCGVNHHGVGERNIGTLTINAGGTLQLDAVNGFANGATNLYLNGGLVTGGPNNFRGDLYLFDGNEQITAGGATTSTIESVIGLTGNNNSITVEPNSTLNITGLVKNSDWTSGGTTPGGFIKSGPGTLALTGECTYTGTTVVNAGTLSLGDGTSPAALSNATSLTVAAGATLDLNFSGTRMIRQLWLGDQWMPLGVYSAAAGLGFITGSGTLMVTVGPKATNILGYGAVPDASSDARAAINTAIASASAGDTVYFPAGVYSISGPIFAKSGVRLEGATSGPSVLRYDGTSTDVMLALYQVSNVTVSHLIFDGNSSTNVSQGIEAKTGSGHRLENLTVRNIGNTPNIFGPHGIIFDWGLTDSEIVNCKIQNIGTGNAYGAGIRIGHGSSRNRITDNIINDTGRGGILCNDGSTDLVILRNTVSGSGGEGLGIELWHGCDRGLVEDNVIDHWLSLESSEFCAIRRNTVSDKSGVYKFLGLEWAGATRDCVFADNLVDGGAVIGISLSGAEPKEYGLWARNTIKGCWAWGSQLQGESGGLSYQYFYQNKFQNTTSTQPGEGHGFRFNGNCRSITLEENEISNNAGDGIGDHTGNDVNQLSFINNAITGNGNGSVWDHFGADIEWTGNTVSGNQWNNQLASRGFANSSKPVAAFTAPTVAVLGQPISFASSSSDPDGSIGHLLWDFGAGLPSTLTNPTFAYSAPGTYIVTLIAWDNLGRASRATRTISVVTVPTGGTMTLSPASPVAAGTELTVSFANWTDPNPPLSYEVLIDDAVISARTSSASRNITGPTTPGLHTLKGRIYNALSDVTEVTRTFTVNTAQESWRQLYFGTTANAGNAADDADPNSNGVQNLLEYVLGGNPLAPSSGILPTATASSGNLVFTFRRIHSTTTDTTQIFQYGTNLTGWTDIPVVAGGIVAIQPDTPQPGTDTVTITLPEGTEPRIFGRLKVSVAPAQP